MKVCFLSNPSWLFPEHKCLNIYLPGRSIKYNSPKKLSSPREKVERDSTWNVLCQASSSPNNKKEPAPFTHIISHWFLTASVLNHKWTFQGYQTLEEVLKNEKKKKRTEQRNIFKEQRRQRHNRRNRGKTTREEKTLQSLHSENFEKILCSWNKIDYNKRRRIRVWKCSLRS